MSNRKEPVGDDKHYKWAFFYYNRSDNRAFVPKRFGFGYTINFGNPYAVTGFVIFILLILFSAFIH